jgi:hypothetical protein
MKKQLLLISLLLGLAVAVSHAQVIKPGEAVENTSTGAINWTTSEVYATGIGASPLHPVNPAQARAMAERAAFVVALRNLLETVKGVQIDSVSVVENFMTRSDVIRSHVDGIVRGARIVKTQYLSDGSVEVLVAISMKGEFLNTLVPESFGRQSPTPVRPSLPSPAPSKPSVPPAALDKKQEPIKPEPSRPAPMPDTKPEPLKPAPIPAESNPEPLLPEPKPTPATSTPSTLAFKGGIATGLVIDGRGLSLRPALLPRIVDPQGEELYVGQVVPRTNVVEQGVAGYAKDVQAAANNFRVTDNPAVIKAIRASGNARTDVVINQADALAFRELGNKGDFLKNCRVIIVY